jgi:hypothetical protein
MPISEKSRSAEPVTKDSLRAEISDVRAEIERQANKLLVWLMGTIIVVAGIAVTVAVRLRS